MIDPALVSYSPLTSHLSVSLNDNTLSNIPTSEISKLGDTVHFHKAELFENTVYKFSLPTKFQPYCIALS